MASAMLTPRALRRTAALKTQGSPGSCLTSSTSPGSKASAESPSPERLPDIDYPTPFVLEEYIVKNTFLESPMDSPTSLEGFFRERETHSCPASVVGHEEPLRTAQELPRSAQEVVELDFDYPSPVVVKNTFLDSPLDRPESLEGFFCERAIHSCPGSGLAGREAAGDERPETPRMQRAPKTAMEEKDSRALSALRARDTALLQRRDAIAAAELTPTQPSQPPLPPPAERAPVSTSMDVLLPPVPAVVLVPAAAAVPSKPQVICIARALSSAQVGASEVPTVGSVGHHMGVCRPCAYHHNRGCTNGERCPYCHLCGSGERKRRQKAKHALKAKMQKLAAAGQPQGQEPQPPRAAPAQQQLPLPSLLRQPLPQPLQPGEIQKEQLQASLRASRTGGA